MSANVAVACATLSVLNGMFFGYALIGFATAAGTLWRCAFDLGPETEANEWGISILFSIINVGGIPFGFVAGSVPFDSWPVFLVFSVCRKRSSVASGALGVSIFLM